MLQVVRRGICCKGKAVVVEGMVAFVMSLPCPDLCRKLHQGLVPYQFQSPLFFLPLLSFLYLKQGLAMQPWWFRNSMASNSQISACLCLLSSETKGVYYHACFLLDSQYSNPNSEAPQSFKATEYPPLSHLSWEFPLVLELDPNFHTLWSLLFLLSNHHFSILLVEYGMSFTVIKHVSSRIYLLALWNG